jgi:glycosyltransferase involved in cell wall biosynthesis
MKHIPKVSVGLPIYNGEKYITQALDSILAQTFEDFELIISDNASTDRTREICLDYAARDSRIKYSRNRQNLGLTRNFNHAFELARGEYFAYMSHDDYIAPDLIARCVEILDNDSSVILCHCQVLIVDEQGKPVAHYDDKLKFHNEDSPYAHKRFRDLIMIPHLCLDDFGLMRTEVLHNINPLYDSFYGSDRNFLAELSLYGKFHHLPDVMFYWRDERDKYAQFNSWLSRLHTWEFWTRRLDTSKPNEIPLPRWSALKGYIKSVGRVKLSRNERLLCYLVVAEWIPKNAKGLFKDLLIASLIFLTWLLPKKKPIQSVSAK